MQRELKKCNCLTKWTARILSAEIIWNFTLIFSLLRWRSRRPDKTPKTILLTAGNASENWIKNHIKPLAKAEACEKIIMVSDQKMKPLGKVVSVIPPGWLKKIIGRTPARLLTYFYLANKYKPEICGGFHLLINGLVALVTARYVRGLAVYFCVGGKTEFIGGAAYNEKFPFGRTGKLNLKLEKRLLWFANQFDQIITMGNGAKQFLIDHNITAPVTAIPGGIDAQVFSPNGDIKKYDIIVTARLVHVKRIDVFLRVISIVAQTYPALRAVIVGDGQEEKYLRDLADNLNIADKVDFAGYQDDIAAYLRQSRVFLLTSDSEGLALSLMEAMMSGLPAVVSDVGDLGDLVENDRNGWLIERRQIQAYAKKITQLLTNQSLLNLFSKQAREDALKLSIAATSKRWQKLLG